MTSGTLPGKIGRYDIQRELGRGMMGVVYQARDPVLQRLVALKTISFAFAVSEKDRESFEARFLQEARAAATLGHPGIVVVYDVGVDAAAGTLYMALEFLRGRTLADVLAAGQPLDWRESLRTAAAVAEALHHAHAHGIVHRDVKPANIMILASGAPKIMDFGVAKLDASQLTTGGRVLGSPSYMSPEQAAGERTDARSDLFSLGSVLYELLTAKKAFGGKDVPTIVTRLAYQDPPPPSTLAAGLPAAVDTVVQRALAKSPSSRYPSAKTLAEDVQDVLDDRPPRHLAGWTAPKPPTTIVSRSAPGPTGAAPAPPAPVADGEGTIRASLGHGLSLPQDKRVSLAILSGSRQGHIFPLSRPTALIGRSGGRAGADIELTDPEVSRAHAVVECHGRRIVLRDLGSTNGTFVGAERVAERELEDKAEFRVGGTRIMVIVSDVE